MTWTINAKNPLFKEGDSGKSGTKFEIKWTGDKFPIDGGGWVHLRVDDFDVTTDVGDQIMIKEAGPGNIVKIYFPPSKDANDKPNKVEVSKTITVTTLGDNNEEDDEVFGVKILSADWYDGPHNDSKLVLQEPKINAVDYAVVIDDDTPGWSMQTHANVIGQIREDGENGVIDKGQAKEIIGALTEKGKSTKIADGIPVKIGGMKAELSEEQYSEFGAGDEFEFQVLVPDVSKDAAFTGIEHLNLVSDLFETEPDRIPLDPDFDPGLTFVGLPTAGESLLFEFG